MPGIDEMLAAKTPLGADIAAGVAAISSNQTIEFTKYVRMVLPIDGYVFWVKADLLSDSALANAGLGNDVAPNAPPTIITPAASFEAEGSFHVARADQQNADANYAVNTVVFTSLREINEFDDVGVNVLWIGSFDGLRFAFSRRKSFYQQADLWHYVGDAVYSTMESQLVDDASGFPANAQIVSNSLPIWLAMNTRPVVDWEPFLSPLRLFPAYLADENLVPPFGTVDVLSDSLVALASAPSLGKRLTHSQQVRERVRITLWGLSNLAVMDFVDFVNQVSLNDGTLGLANSPVPRDPKSTQVELGTIAKKKVIEYEVNYEQFAARDIARQLILRAIPTFIFN